MKPEILTISVQSPVSGPQYEVGLLAQELTIVGYAQSALKTAGFHNHQVDLVVRTVEELGYPNGLPDWDALVETAHALRYKKLAPWHAIECLIQHPWAFQDDVVHCFMDHIKMYDYEVVFQIVGNEMSWNNFTSPQKIASCRRFLFGR